MKRHPCISQWHGLRKHYDQQFTYSVYLARTHDGLYSMAKLLEMDYQKLKEQMLTFGGKYVMITNNIVYPTIEEAQNAQKYVCMALKLQGKGKPLG